MRYQQSYILHLRFTICILRSNGTYGKDSSLIYLFMHTYLLWLLQVITYALTVQLLKKKARFIVEHSESETFRR